MSAKYFKAAGVAIFVVYMRVARVSGKRSVYCLHQKQQKHMTELMLP